MMPMKVLQIIATAGLLTNLLDLMKTKPGIRLNDPDSHIFFAFVNVLHYGAFHEYDPELVVIQRGADEKLLDWHSWKPH